MKLDLATSFKMCTINVRIARQRKEKNIVISCASSLVRGKENPTQDSFCFIRGQEDGSVGKVLAGQEGGSRVEAPRNHRQGEDDGYHL